MRASRMTAVAVQCALLGLPVVARAATRTYPGTAPCNGTLQGCITGASSGDRIEIATASQIAEDLTIAKSLTLTSAPGVRAFVGGELVPQDDTRLHQVTINEDPAGGATAIVISSLNLTANIELTFATGTGHSFALQHCDLVRPDLTYGGDLPLVVFSELEVPASLDISNNLFDASDTNVNVQTNSGDTDVENVMVVGNRFLGQSVNPESSSAVHLELETGQTKAKIWSNLVHRQSLGAEGWGFSFIHNDYFGTASGVIDITGNTVDLDNASSSYGMLAYGLDNFQIGLFNNIFSHMPEFGGEGTAMVAQNNDFFAVDYIDPQLQSPELQLYVDPGYVDRDNGDYHLTSTSLLVNAGFNAATGGLSAADADGNPRVAGGTVDVGAFEYAPPTSGGSGGAAGEAGQAGAMGEAGAGNRTGGGSGSLAGGSGGQLNTGGGVSTGGAATGGAATGGGNTLGSAGSAATGGSSTSSAGGSSSAGEPGAGGGPVGGAPNGGAEANGGGAGTAGSNGQSSDDGGCTIHGASKERGAPWLTLLLAALAVGSARRRKRRSGQA